MYLIIIKILVSVVVVLALIFISEKSPKLGGLLVGLPIGTGIMIFFYGIEQGVDFVTQSIPYGIAGLTGLLSFSVGFYLGGNKFKNSRLLSTLSALTGAFVLFFVMNFLLSFFKINLIVSLIIFVIGILLAILFFKRIPVDKKSIPKKITFSTVTFRILFVTVTVLLITGLAKIIGIKWSGLMASFPVGLCPLLIVLTYTYKDKLYPTVLKTFSYSVTTLVVFYLLVLVLFPPVGVYYGILIAYLICFAYLYIISKIKSLNLLKS